MFFLPFFACSDNSFKTFNDAPTAIIISHDEEEFVREGEPQFFEATISDSNNATNTLLARWLVNGEEICTWLPADELGVSSCMHTFTQSNLILENSQDTGSIDDEFQRVEIQVQDPQNATGIFDLNIGVFPNAPPIALIQSPEEGRPLYKGVPVEFISHISDEDHDVFDLEVYWESDLEGELDIELNVSEDGIVNGLHYLQEGSHILSFVVTDPLGKSDTEQTFVTVGPPNTPPECSILSPVTATRIMENETVVFVATATDIDTSNDVLEVEWFSNIDGLLGSSMVDSTGSTTFSHSGFSPTSHSVSMIVTDDAGETCSSSILLDIAGGPEINIVFPTDGAVVNDGVSIYFEANILDDTTAPNDLNVSLSSSIDGEIEIPPLDSQGNFSTYIENLTVGDHILTLQASDEDGMMNNEILQLRINGIPSPPVIEITPENPVEGIDDLHCNIVEDGTDPDEDTLTYIYNWFVDEQPTPYTTDSIPASETLFGQNWTCEVQSNDGYAQSETIIADTQIISDCASLYLDGLGDGISLSESDENIYDIDVHFSIHAWVYLDADFQNTTMSIFDAEHTRGSVASEQSGFALVVHEGKIGLALAASDSSEQYIFSNMAPLETNQWIQIIAVRNANQLQIWNNGFLIVDRTDLPNGSVQFDGGTYDHSNYSIGLSTPQGVSGPEIGFMGAIRNVAVWNRALSESEAVGLFYQEFDTSIPDTQSYWSISESYGSDIIDEGLQEYLGTTLGDSAWIDSCPFSDNDLDGYPAWTDCNDDDVNAYTYDGSSAACAGISCKQIYFGSLGFVNGIYWLDPDNTSPFEAYCDMSNGGWTLVMKSIQDNFDYNDPVWTTTSVESEDNFDFTNAGRSKYIAFNSVPFSQIRSTDPILFTDEYVHNFAQTKTSALNLFSGQGIDATGGLVAFFNDISTPENQSTGCGQFQKYGFNQLDLFGLQPVGTQSDCDHNGGARWGQRVNATLQGDPAHSGQGWGAYSTICTPYSLDGSHDPICDTGLFQITQLMWVK